MNARFPNSILGILCLAASAAAAGETRWFVVSEIEPERNESYLLPLSDPDAIRQARVLVERGIDNGEVGSIASVRIAAGADGFNRSILEDGQPLWSWHVVEFEGFSDFAIELCDGWPGFIEEDVDAFIENTNGQVCFWGYTVTAELEEAPAFAINRELRGGWFNPATPGQGLMLDVFEPLGQMFAAWFTFETAGITAKLGSPEHRWLTAQGEYTGSLAALDVTVTSGGLFDDPAPVDHSEPGSVGTVQLRFEDCNHGEVQYAFADGTGGQFSIERLVPVAGCEPD